MATRSQRDIEEANKRRLRYLGNTAAQARRARTARGGSAFKNVMSGIGEGIARFSGQAQKYADEITGIPNVIGGTVSRAVENVQRPEGVGRALGSAMAGRTISRMPTPQQRMVTPQVGTSIGGPAEPVEDYTGMYAGTGVTDAMQAGAPVAPAGGGAGNRYLGGGATPAPELNKMLPGREAALAKYGIRSLGANEDQRLESLYNSLDNTRDTKRRANIQNQINVIESGRVRKEQTAARQQLAETAMEGEIAKAMAGDQKAYAKMRNDYNIADLETKRKMKNDFFASGLKSGVYSVDELIKEWDNVAGNQQAQAQAGGGDVNGDGQISAQEAEYNEIATMLKNKPPNMTPADEKRFKDRLAELSAVVFPKAKA